MTTVRKLLDAKEAELSHSVGADDTVFRALEVMAAADIGAVFVKEGDKIVGIYTERDYARKGELAGCTAQSTRLREVMTGDMYTVTMDTTTEQCIALMQSRRIRHLPVVENGRLVGMVSMRDVMLAALKERESEIKGLENYILASGFRG